jgi:hypothetical protein
LDPTTTKAAHILFDEQGLDVLFKGKAASRIKVNPGADLDTGLFQAIREPASTAEKINRLDFAHDVS